MNRTRVRIAILAFPLAGLGMGLGCLGQAERTYFDDLIDGSADGTVVVDSPSGPDTSLPSDGQVLPGDDAAGDAPNVQIDAAVRDAGLDSSDLDSAVFDSADLDSAVFDSAPVESGCGPTNTVSNCGQCGAACDTTHSAPSSCTAGACQYNCNAGWGDCQPAAPNTNGCETPLTTPLNCTACGAACDTTRSNGAACAGNGCSYTGCQAGWGDCQPAAPNTNGCETPLTTPLNCTACGIACDTTHSTGAACAGTGCMYTGCQAGWHDCNSAAPNANGCECQSPGCCGDGGCEPQHDNGVGQSYYDCTPVGVYSSSLALKACVAYTDAAAQCVGYPCADPDSGPIICSSGALNKFCMCWSYAGSNVGLVDNAGENPGTNGAHCFCPSASVGDTPWN